MCTGFILFKFYKKYEYLMFTSIIINSVDMKPKKIIMSGDYYFNPIIHFFQTFPEWVYNSNKYVNA